MPPAPWLAVCSKAASSSSTIWYRVCTKHGTRSSNLSSSRFGIRDLVRLESDLASDQVPDLAPDQLPDLVQDVAPDFVPVRANSVRDVVPA